METRFVNEEELEMLNEIQIKIVDDFEAELSKLSDFEKRDLVEAVVKARLMNKGLDEPQAAASASRITEKLQAQGRLNISGRQKFGDLRTSKPKVDPARL